MRSIPVIELCHGGDRCTGGGIAVNDIDLLHGVQLESFAEQRIQKQNFGLFTLSNLIFLAILLGVWFLLR